MYVWIIAAVLLAVFICFGYIRKPGIPGRLCLRTKNMGTGIEQLYPIRKDIKTVLLPFVNETGSFHVKTGGMNFQITIRAHENRRDFIVTGTSGFYDLILRQTIVMPHLPKATVGEMRPQINRLFRDMVFSYSGFQFGIYLPDRLRWNGDLENQINADLIKRH
ncbi:MAG: hypothetical protein IKG46_12755 [Solobacterium sp.]|nr:hypothetical protein [Solobacterium sp.]